MKPIILFALLFASICASGQTSDTIPEPSLYEWFFPASPDVVVQSTATLKTKDVLGKKFESKAGRMAVRWLRKAERTRAQAEALRMEANALIEKANAMKDEAVLMERQALFFEAEKVRLLKWKFD